MAIPTQDLTAHENKCRSDETCLSGEYNILLVPLIPLTPDPTGFLECLLYEIIS